VRGTYVSVADVDGFYADALGNIFRASSVLVKIRVRLRDQALVLRPRRGSSHVCHSCMWGISC